LCKIYFMQIILALHSLVRWAILLFGLWAFINALTGVLGKRSFTAGDNRSSLLFMISFDMQFLLGIALYFGNSWFSMLKDNAKVVMQDDTTRFFAVEHVFMMIIAWILVHVGRSSVKKAATDSAKHKRMLLYFGLAILLILIAMPWPFRETVSRPWFRSFN
jgi:hypothetical protein